MQKIERKASILIWSIFISLIVSMTFISISVKINKNIKQNNNIIENIETENELKNEIKKQIEDENFENKNIGKYKIIFEENNRKIIGLKENQEISLNIPEEQNITIKIINGGIINYINSDNSNGIIYSKDTFTASIGETKIKNLSGYSKIEITSEKEFETNEKNYKIIKTIGNKEVEKTSKTITIN